MREQNFFQKQILVLLVFFMATPVLWAGNITVTINDHNGNQLTGAKFKIFKGPNYIGEHSSGTTVALQDGDTYKIFAHHNSTSTDRLTYTVDGDDNLTFQTTLVKIQFGGNYLDYRGSGAWKPFQGPSMELFPNDFYGNTMRFRFGDHWQNPNYVEKTVDYSGQTTFEGNAYTFKVKNEAGAGIANVPIEWHYNTNYSNTWKNIGTTDANGMLVSIEDVTKTGLQPFRAKYNKTSQTKSTSGYAEFQTTVATALVTNCEQGPISGVNVDFLWHGNYTGNNWRINVGTTGSDGKASIELFPGNHKFEAKLNHTTSVKTFDLNYHEDVDVEFNPSLVNMDYAGTVKWKYNNYYYTDVTEDYLMFPGTYKFRFSGADNFIGTYDMEVSGCEFGGNVYIFKVKNEAGEGIANVPIEWHFNTNYGNTYKEIGTTDENGLLFSVGDVWKTGSQPFRAEYNKTKQRKLTAGYLEFQTAVATALVTNCEQGPISGVNVDFLWHGNYTGNNWRINVGETDSNGKASIELFPGNHKFEAKLNHTTSVKTFDLDYNEDVDVEFNPTLVNMDYAGTVKWKYNNYYYTDVTEDYLMFPGTYKFRFSGADNFTGTYDMEVSGCEFGGNVYIFKVKNEAGEGIANVPIEWHYNTNYGNTYKEIGTTDENGLLFSVGDVWKTGAQPFKAKYNSTTQRKETSGYLEFQTTVATALVENCVQGPISGVNVDFLWHPNYFGNNWRINVGETGSDGKASIELFPGNHKFEAKLNYTTSVQNFDLDYNEDVDIEFQPTLVNMDYAGTVEWKYNNYYYTDVTPDYLMFSGNYQFKFSGDDIFTGIQTMYVSGCEFGADLFEGEGTKQGVAGAPSISLMNIYPNPVKGAARIQYNLEQDNNVSISVYNSIGVEVERLISSTQMQGNHELIWDTQNLKPGFYYIRLNIGNQQNVKPVIVQ